MRFVLAGLLLVASGCASFRALVPPDATRVAPDTFVDPIASGVWRHVSHRDFTAIGPYPSNGLILRVDGGAVLVDTAWDDAATNQILDWTERHVGPVKAVIVTHSHADRMGGLGAVHARGIRTIASSKTIALAKAEGALVPREGYDVARSLADLGLDGGEVRVVGPGHTVDNAVVWIPESSLLFGGCLVRSAQTSVLGNTTEADKAAWPQTLRAVRERYSSAKQVVPGHGPSGTLALLTHTIALLE